MISVIDSFEELCIPTNNTRRLGSIAVVAGVDKRPCSSSKNQGSASPSELLAVDQTGFEATSQREFQ